MSLCQTCQLIVHCILNPHNLVCSDVENVTLFCITGSGSVLSPLFQTLTEGLTKASTVVIWTTGGGMAWITQEFAPVRGSSMV
jgi:hypothetical protein